MSSFFRTMSKDTDKASLFSILRSNDVAALNEWLNTSGMNSKTVYELLGGVYEELHLRNFPLSPETRFEVEWKLVELQFSQGSCKSETSDFKNFKSTKIHLDITCQHIEQFLGKYQQLTPKIDLAFVVDAKFVALHLSVLKNRLPFSYKKLPWQEMEFLLVIFILVITKTYELDVTYGLLVDYALVRKQLEHFLNELKELQIWFTREDALSNSKSDKEQLNAINEELKKLNVKGLTGRKGNMQVILKNSPQFDDLYSHFNVVRDIYSLNCIQHYLDISSAVDLKQDFLIGSLVIQRAFQVIGEYLKDEADSPNSSSDLYFILVKLVSKNLRKTMQDLRNTLSHSHGLNKRIEIEEFKHRDAFSNIQLELKGISREIVRVLYQRKTDGLIMFLRKLDSDITMEKVQDLDSRIDISKIGKLKVSEILNLDHIKSWLTNFWQEVKDHVPDPSHIAEVFQILRKAESEIQETATSYHSTLKHIKHMLSLKDINIIKNIGRTYLGNLQNKELSGIFEEMFGLLHQIYLTYKTNRGFNVKDTKTADKKLINTTKIMLVIHESLKWNLHKISWIENIHKELEVEKDHFFKDIVDTWFKQIKNELNAKGSNGGDIFYDEILKQKRMHYLRTTLLSNMNNKEFLKILNEEDEKEPMSLDMKKMITKFYNKKKSADLKRRIEQIPNYYGSLIKNLVDPKVNNLRVHIEYVHSFLSKIQLKNYTVNSENSIIDSAKSLSQNIIINDLKSNYTKRLLALKNIHTQISSFKLQEVSETLVVALEMLLLDLTECLNKIGCLVDNATFLVEQLPILGGKQLRNHLAHGNITTHILPYNIRIPLFVYATYLMEIPVDKLISLDTVWSLGLNCDWFNESMEKYIGRCQNIVEQQDHLFGSIERSCNDVAIELMKSGAETYAADMNLNTGLDIAILHGNQRFFTYIVSNNLRIEDIVQHVNPRNIVRNFEVFRYLLQHSYITASSAFEHNKTLLHLAAEVGQRDTLEYLIDNNLVNVKSKTTFQETAFHLASKNGYIDIFQILTHWDFDIDEKTLPNGSTALHLAIENGHYDIVVELVKRNADCLQKTADDFTPLQLAIRAGYEDIVALIFNTSKQNMKEEETLDALMLASKYGLKDAVQILLNTGIDVNSKNDDGITALWTAAAFGQAHITKWLLSQRADVNLQNGVCSTALHVASRYGHLAVVDCLISFNADVNACNKGNHTPLHFAFENNNIDIIEKLVACPTIIVNPFSIEGMTPYHVAAEIQNPGSLKWYIEKFPEYIDICTQGKKATALHLAAGKGLLASVQLLLGHNANVNSLTAENATPLHWAIQRHGYKEIVEELIANNADPNSKNVDGATPLHVAVLNQNEDIFQILLNHRADVSLCDNTKFTPLHTACMNSSVFIVKELILKVPNVNILDDNNSTPLHHAASKGFLEAVRLLLENDADSNHVNLQNNSALHLAAFNGYQNIVQLLVAHSAEINARNSLNQTPILMAIEKLHQDVVMFLYKEGADISQNADDYKLNGTSILISALQKKSEIIAKLILEIPNIAIDVNATTASGDTALHLACSNGFTDCVEKLLSFNIDINGKTKNGLTPLHYAAYRGYDSIVKKLVLKGARVDEMANIAYPTAFSCAVANGNTKVVEFLLEHQPDVNVQCHRSTTPCKLLF
ncbi:uncharacterized protein LOC109540331 [Dendroctonus ponderosae]|uniref:uncharacterized protein LOC109540331 n=1 Tax=Dendroctonus ponderosae TaxID=77166 RepID=UPI0020361045|nr:uncharacterized protein LOC109540331 [Dendroctonus ponderosae]